MLLIDIYFFLVVNHKLDNKALMNEQSTYTVIKCKEDCLIPVEQSQNNGCRFILIT